MGILQQQLLGAFLLIVGAIMLMWLVKSNKPKNFKVFKRRHPLLGAALGSDYFYGRLQGMLPAAIFIWSPAAAFITTWLYAGRLHNSYRLCQRPASYLY